MPARPLLSSRSNSSRRRRASSWIGAGLVLLLLVPVVGRAQGIWDQLSPQEQQAVLTKVRDQLRADLAADEPVLPAFSDPRLQAAASAMLGPDTAELARHAGELSAGEYDRAINAGLDAAAGQLAQYLLEQAKGRLPEDSATRVYLEYVAGKGDALKTIGQAFFDDRKSWTDFVEVTWTELNKAAVEDVQAAAEDAVKRTINFALGEGSLPGLSPGEVYLEVLKAEVVLVRQFELASVRLAADNLYREYRSEREAGASAFFAWDNVYTTMLGSSGLAEMSAALGSGSTEDLRLGAYVLRHVDADTLARRFEECFQNGEDPCTVQVETAAEQQQAEARRWVQGQVDDLKQRIRGETAAIGRDQIRSLYAHIGDSLRREMMAAYQATDSQQQGMREARYTAEARLGRIRQLALDVAGRCQEFGSIEAQARSTLGYFNSLDAQVADVERLMSQARRCGPGADASALTDLASRRDALVTAADQASTAACSWNDPTTVAEATEVMRQALGEASRTSTAAEQARALAEQLRTAAGAAPAASVDTEAEAARQALQDMLPVLDEAVRTASNVMNLRASMRDHAGRGNQQYDVGMEWLRELDEAVAPFRGMPEFDQLRDEAQRLMGAGPYGERDDTVLACSARMQAALGAFEREARPDGASLEANRDVLARWRSEAQGAIAACSGGAGDTVDVAALVAAADADEARLDAYVDAAALCAGRAQQLSADLERTEQQADEADDPGADPGDRDPDPGDPGPADAGRTGSGDEEGGELWIAARVFMPDNLPGMLGGLQEEGADPQQVLDRVRQTLSDTDPSAVSWTSENTGEVFIRVSPEHAAAVREQLRGGDRFSVGVGMETAAAGGLDIEGSMLMEAAGAFGSRDELVAAFPDFDPGQLVDLDASGSGSMRSGSGEGAMTIRMGDIEGGWSEGRQQEAIGLMADAMTTFVAAAMDPASGLATEDCFVATAVYGDVAAPELTPLRRFRDRVLLTHPAGRQLVRFYYRQGPAWAEWVRERPVVRAGLRWLLDRAGPRLGRLESDDLVVRWSRPLLRLAAGLVGEPGSR